MNAKDAETKNENHHGEDSLGNKGGDDRGGDEATASAKELKETETSSNNGGEGAAPTGKNNGSSGEGEGSKRKNDEVAPTPERPARGMRGATSKTPGVDSIRTRGPEAKKNKKDISDFFAKTRKNK